jgi:hypothetical protein
MMVEVSLIGLYCPLVNFGVTNALEVDAQFLAGGEYPQLKAAHAGAQGKVTDGLQRVLTFRVD